MSNTLKLILPGHSPRRVRNFYGQPLLCCYAECDQAGDDKIQVAIPHPQAKWDGEKLIYIFCSTACRQAYLDGTPWENRG